MSQEDPKPKRTTAQWEIADHVLRDFREFCESRHLNESEAACQAIKRYLAERILEEGE